MVVIDKQQRECKIINIAVATDQNIKVKKLEKITKYQDLGLQMKRLWDVKTTVIPIMVGALEAVSEELENQLETVGVAIVIIYLQNTVLLETAFILKKVLGS